MFWDGFPAWLWTLRSLKKRSLFSSSTATQCLTRWRHNLPVDESMTQWGNWSAGREGRLRSQGRSCCFQILSFVSSAQVAWIPSHVLLLPVRYMPLPTAELAIQPSLNTHVNCPPVASMFPWCVCTLLGTFLLSGGMKNCTGVYSSNPKTFCFLENSCERLWSLNCWHFPYSDLIGDHILKMYCIFNVMKWLLEKDPEELVVEKVPYI